MRTTSPNIPILGGFVPSAAMTIAASAASTAVFGSSSLSASPLWIRASSIALSNGVFGGASIPELRVKAQRI